MELTENTMKKGKFFKIKLAWLCGKLNYLIEHNAKLGRGYAKIDNITKRVSKVYFPLMAKFYEADGYIVYYKTCSDYFNHFTVYWNKNDISLTDVFGCDYYTKGKKK